MMHNVNEEETKSMILLCYKTYQALKGFAPCLSELCSMTGIRSYLTVEKSLRELRREGLIREARELHVAAV